MRRLPRRGPRAMFAPAVRVGRRAFVGGALPTDWSAALLPPEDGYPFHHDPLRAQSEVVLSELATSLFELGMTPADTVHLTQWLAPDVGITPYMETRARLLPGATFASVATAARRLPVAGALLCVEAIATTGVPRTPIAPAGRPFPAGVLAGPMLHLSGELAIDWPPAPSPSPPNQEPHPSRGRALGIPPGQDGGQPRVLNFGPAPAPEARVDPAFWYGHPVAAQADVVLRRLAELAAEAGTDLRRAARATVFLDDRRHLGMLEDVWRRHFPGPAAPARTVITGCGLAGRDCVVEVALDIPVGAAPEPVDASDLAHPPAHESPAMVADGLLYVSGQMAVGAGEHDPVFGDLRSPAREQLARALERIDALCRAAGGGLDDVAFARLYLSDLRRLGEALPAWEAAFGGDVPAGSAVGVGPLPVPGCVVMVDAIARVP